MTFNIGLINKITKKYNYIYCTTDPVTITYNVLPDMHIIRLYQKIYKLKYFLKVLWKCGI